MDELEPRRLMSTSSFYVRTDLVSDNGVAGTRTDANLVNGWGLTRGTPTPWWVSDAGSGVSTLYNAAGAPQALALDSKQHPE